MSNPLFDVVSFGTELHGVERAKACKALATILKIDLQRAQELLAQDRAIIRHAIPEDEAESLTRLLNRVGIRGHCRPALPSSDELELVPLDDEADGPRVTICPECQTKTTTEQGQPEPEICPRCGLVFAKYERALRRHPELERIRQALRRPQQSEQDHETEETERGETPVFHLPTEEPPAAPLPLPAAIDPRKRIATLATAFFLVGAVSGVAGSWLFSRFAAPKPGDSALGTENSQAVDSSIAARTLRFSSAAGTAPLIELLLAVESGDDAKPPPGAASHPLPQTMPDRATPASLAIRAAPRRIMTGTDDIVGVFGRMALDSLRGNDRPLADALLVEMRKLTADLPDGLQSVETLAETADVLEQAGDDPGAAASLEQALKQAERLPPGMDKVLAFATLAATAAWTGRITEENRWFRTANREWLAIRDSSMGLQTLCLVAERYALAGQRGGALALLEAVARAAPRVENADQRDALYLRLVRAHSRIGDIDGALRVIAQVRAPALQDSALHEAAVAAAESGHLTWSQELAERIKTPRYAADAFARLGQLRSSNPTEQDQALRSFAIAETWAKQVTDPATQVNVLGRLGEAYALSGKNERAAPMFESAMNAARSIEDPKQRDEALQTLANAQLASMLPQLASQTASGVADPAVKAELERKIEAVQRITAIRPSPG